MSEVDREELVKLAVRRHFVDWAYNQVSKDVPCIDSGFSDRINDLESSLAFARLTIEKYMNTLMRTDLEFAAGLNGATLEIGIETTLQNICQKARGSLSKYSKLELIAFGVYPGELADYNYWSMRDRFTLQEFVWISMGLEPTDNLQIYFSQVIRDQKKINQLLLKEVKRRTALFVGARGLEILGDSVRADLAHGWLASVNLDVPRGFSEMLDVCWKRLSVSASDDECSETNEASDRKPDPREVRSMAKLITAIAITEYGYDPLARRSPIPKEIEGICDQQGLGVSKETIRRYLQIGANLSKNGDGK